MPPPRLQPALLPALLAELDRLASLLGPLWAEATRTLAARAAVSYVRMNEKCRGVVLPKHLLLCVWAKETE